MTSNNSAFSNVGSNLRNGANSIVFSSENTCLYVCGRNGDQGILAVFDLAGNLQDQWQLPLGSPIGICTSMAFTVTVAVVDSNLLYEHSPTGVLVNTINLQPSEITEPRYIVRRNDGKYVVTCRENICVVDDMDDVDADKRCLVSYGNNPVVGNLAMSVGFTRAANGCLLYMENNKLILFNMALSEAQEIKFPDNFQPANFAALHCDIKSNRIYIGDKSGNVVVFDFPFEVGRTLAYTDIFSAADNIIQKYETLLEILLFFIIR